MNSVVMLAIVALIVAGFLVAVFFGTQKRDKAFDSWPSAAKKLKLSRRPYLPLLGPKISGKLEGHHVSVTLDREEDGGSSHALTCYRVRMKHPAGLPSEVTKDTLRAAGRAGFEGLSADANAKLRELFKAYPESEIAGHEVRLDLVGISDGPKIMAVLHQMTALAGALAAKE